MTRRTSLLILSLLSFLSLLTHDVRAQSTNKDSQLINKDSIKVDYILPYPGILPDHPLYKLKVLRDKIVLAITNNPQKKAKYRLLLADKRIYMSRLLVDKGKIALAKETALKGEHEYTLLTFGFKNANKKPDASFMDKLTRAAAKHQELLNEIIEKVDQPDKQIFRTVLEFSQRNLDEIKKIYNK